MVRRRRQPLNRDARTTTIAGEDDVADRPTAARSERERVAALAAVALAVAPFVVAIAANAGRDHVPLGDYALTDLRVRDVWTRDVPLVGAYSRFGWNHPGPAPYWLFAPISAVLGRPAWATLVAGVFFQGLTVAGIAWTAWRGGRLPLLLAAAAFTGLAYGAMGPSMVLDAWNPNFAFPLFVLFVLLAWQLALGDRPLLVPLVVVASLLVQAHVGYAPLTAVAAGIAVVLGVRRAAGGSAAWRRPAVLALTAGAVLWAPPIVHELVRPSNVRPLAQSLFDADEPTLGFATAGRVLAEEFRVPPPWLGGDHDVETFAGLVVGESSAWLLLPAALLAAAWAADRRRHAFGSQPLLLLATALLVVALFAVARVRGDPERYVFYWRVPIALLVVFAGVVSLGIGFGLDRSRLVRRLGLALLAVVVMFASVTSSVRVAAYDGADAAQAVAADAVEAISAPATEANGMIVRSPRVSLVGLHRSVVNELDRDGVQVRVDEELGYQFGYSRAASEAEVDEIWYVVESGDLVSVLTGEPGARELWASTPLGPRDEAALRRAQRRLWVTIRDAGRPELMSSLASPLVAFAVSEVPGIDRGLIERVATLNERAEREGPCRCAVVAFDVADDPGPWP